MSCSEGISANRRQFWPRSAATAGLFAIACPARAAEGEFAAASALTAAVFALALAALALTVIALLALRAARSRRAIAEELRVARARAQALDQVLDVWSWQTDAEHRLTAIRPPPGAAAADWSAQPNAGSPALLWERFDVDDASALQARMSSGAALDDVKVGLGGDRAGLLRARAIGDATGRFAGYQGMVRELAAGKAVANASLASPSALPAAQSAGLPAALPTTLPAPAGTDHDSFSYTVSHDLRAPIRVVEGFTKIVKEDYGRLLDRVGNDHLDRVLGAAARMNNMIDALLALSKLSSQPLARQPVNLSQLAGFVVDDLRRQWPDRAVQIEIAPDMQVHGDPTLLRVVIENLLGNAWKYTGKTDSPSIAFGRHPQRADSFCIIDNGAGFDMRFADRLFGVFQRLHSANEFPGTGIGLASVQRIVRRHGGEIWGEGEVSRGARFHFTLPQRD